MSRRLEAEPYRPRRTWWIENRQLGGWLWKIYGIEASSSQGRLTPSVQRSAIENARRHLENLHASATPFGILTLHAGELGVWSLLDLWYLDIVHHFVDFADFADPESFAKGPADGTSACVWEMEVTQFERGAWVEHVLSQPANPDFESYLKAHLEIAVVAT